MFTAIKPVYNRSTKEFDVECVENADPIYAHHGYLVFSDKTDTLAKVLSGVLIPSWSAPKRKAILNWLRK